MRPPPTYMPTWWMPAGLPPKNSRSPGRRSSRLPRCLPAVHWARLVRGSDTPAAALVDSSLSPLARNPLARVVPADALDGAPTLVAMVAVAQALAGALVPPRREIAAAGLAAVGA